MIWLSTVLFVVIASQSAFAEEVYFSHTDVQVVAKKRAELIDWNTRVKKAGVRVLADYPGIEKTSSGYSIQLSDYLPRAVVERSLSGFHGQSAVNCHGATQFIHGLAPELTSFFGVSAVAFPALCRRVHHTSSLRAGDIGIIHGVNHPHSHSFTYISSDLVLQLPGMGRGEYPRLMSLPEMMKSYVDRKVSDPSRREPSCKTPEATPGKCDYWVEYYRCDFSRSPKLGVFRAATAHPGEIVIGQADSKIDRLEDAVKRVRSWDQLGALLLQPFPTEFTDLLEMSSAKSLSRDQVRGLSMAWIRFEALFGRIQDKMYELLDTKIPWPSNYGPDEKLKLSPGISFGSEQSKKSRFLIDNLVCLNMYVFQPEAARFCGEIFASLKLSPRLSIDEPLVPFSLQCEESLTRSQ